MRDGVVTGRFPLGGQTGVIRTVGKRRAFTQYDFSVTTDVLVHAEFLVDVAVLGHASYVIQRNEVEIFIAIANLSHGFVSIERLELFLRW